jgi:hypothetical protein
MSLSAIIVPITSIGAKNTKILKKKIKVPVKKIEKTIE